MTNHLYNADLWISLKDPHCDGDHYLVEANPHTYAGRMSGWCSLKHVGFNVSASEIENCTEAAKWWIAGYISGNEPEPPLDDECLEVDEDTEEYNRWDSARALYRHTGAWPVSAPSAKNYPDTL